MTDNRISNEAASMVQVDPATLLVDRNVRSDVRLDRDFLASVRDLGVLVPIVAVRTEGGELRVRYGHRRTLAAVEAGYAYVPVVVVADDGTDDAAEVARLVGQYAENEHRSGLTTGERVDVFTQLSAFGVSAAQIAKRTKTKRREVDAALTVAGSDLARAATARYDFLNLEQAAVVADFDNDAEAVKALVLAAREGGFDHLAQRLRDDRAEQTVIDAEAERLASQGVVVIERPRWSDPATELDRLAAADARPLDPRPMRVVRDTLPTSWPPTTTTPSRRWRSTSARTPTPTATAPSGQSRPEQRSRPTSPVRKRLDRSAGGCWPTTRRGGQPRRCGGSG